MSHRDGDGGDTTEPGDEELTAEEEFRQWAESAEAAQQYDDDAGSRRGWAGRIFSRKSTEPELPAADEAAEDAVAEPEPADLENADPEDLGVFQAIRLDDGPPPELRAVPDEPVAEPEPPAPVIDQLASAPDVGPAPQGDEPQDQTPEDQPDAQAIQATQAQLELESTVPPGSPGSPGFSDLWDPKAESEAEDADDVIDFADFTSEDYLAATTREYAGLAEAVARAEEEGTQRMAVSADIRGLESGLVGLDDVVDAESGTGSADLIEPPSGSELSVRVLTAFGLLVLFGASLLSPYGIGALIFVVLGIAAGEMFAAFIRSGYHPLSIFGFLGIAGAFIGTWMAGPVAVPVALLITTVAVFLFYATVPGRKAAVENATLTVLVTVWIGGLGAFAFDFLDSDDYVWLVLGLVVTVAAMDVGQYFIGKRLGRRALAPVVSPKKTVEGYVAGIVVAITVGAAFAWASPFDLGDGLLIGAVVAIVSPMGDLAVSVVKRALGVKDMGYILPGHGGVLDRVDAMIITIPALWIAYSWMGLLI